METTGQVADLLAEIGLLRSQRDALQARRDDCAVLLAEKQAEVKRLRGALQEVEFELHGTIPIEYCDASDPLFKATVRAFRVAHAALGEGK